MVAQTSNSIEIQAPRAFVFERTNDLPSWTELFTEYKSVEILERRENYFVFRLTTHPNEEGKSWSWTSWRSIFPDEWRIEAARIEPLTPFASMAICWYYEMQGEDSTVMRWEQEFTVASSAGFTENDSVAYINRSTRVQMQAIKERLEAAWQGQRSQDGVEPWTENSPVASS